MYIFCISKNIGVAKTRLEALKMRINQGSLDESSCFSKEDV